MKSLFNRYFVFDIFYPRFSSITENSEVTNKVLWMDTKLVLFMIPQRIKDEINSK